ncbi:MAG TPA: hypothetical protein VNW71_02975, partial [Thermoanaerobaculia bacterium]|nr:hypothetical protein [Thermoanaerobaculia bacterium]
ALLGMAEVLRKARRYEEMGLTSKDPVGAYRRLMTAASLTGQEAFAKLMSKEITRGMSGGERQSFWEGFENGLKGAVHKAREDMPVEVAIDLALAVMRETVSGDDSLGYRIAMSAATGDDHSIGYVIPEDGEYRIAAVDRALWLIGGEALRRLERNDLRGARQWLDWAHEELDGGDRADPFQSSAFLDLWTRGAQGDMEQVRCAAASLLSFESTMSQTLPILTACRQTAVSEAPEGPRRAALDRALLAAYLVLDRHEEAAETAFRLAETSTSEVLYRAQLRSLGNLRRWDDMRRIADARLARTPDDVLAQMTLAEVAVRKGDFDEAERIYQRFLGTGKANADQYNTAAWIALVRGRADERVLELAQRAASLSDYQDYGILHTLAAVYAEQGKAAEAYRIILQALELKGEPDADDLYVFGRLAEHYGLPEAARHYYEKAGAQSTGDDNPMDTIHLVRKRLQALGKPPEPKQVATRR